jgi:metallo-beta-lactamase family protein
MATAPVLAFHGGVGTVTGRRFALETHQARVLVEAGLFQGLRELRRRNWDPPPFDPARLDAVLLTHAHLDHCGYLPRLARDGLNAHVLASPYTAELAEIVLRDSAHLQEEDARYAAEKGFSKHAHPEPLYDTVDVETALRLFEPLPFGERRAIAAGVHATLHPAGHILGGSVAEVEVDGRRVVFSGDLGRANHPLMEPPGPPPAADVIVVESTYGNRRHEPDGRVLADAIRRTVQRGGSVLIPAFAVDRTEVLLQALRRLVRLGEIPDLPVWVDSPMALAALEVYRRAVREGSPELRADVVRAGGDLFDPGRLREARTAEQSMALNAPGVPSIVISASGMASGGRVVHHLRAMLPDPRNTVVLVGYQAIGTRGRDLAEGATQLKMHGRYVPVRAEIAQAQAFSVHADSDELIGWLASTPKAPEACYVVHGEPEASAALVHRIGAELGWLAVAPRPGDRVRLD